MRDASIMSKTHQRIKPNQETSGMKMVACADAPAF